jgi:hypothetical protein
MVSVGRAFCATESQRAPSPGMSTEGPAIKRSSRKRGEVSKLLLYGCPAVTSHLRPRHVATGRGQAYECPPALLLEGRKVGFPGSHQYPRPNA